MITQASFSSMAVVCQGCPMLHDKDLCLHGNNVMVFFFSGGKHQLQSVQQKIMAFSIHTHLLTHMHACTYTQGSTSI